MSESWREFEQLVARIEKQLAPKGAIVKSPDKIQDKFTGQMREVDASIRWQIGSVPILITVECRERSNVQDDTWIEQLISKRQKIGAHQTIAVSASGFTKPAITSADKFGVELRKIEEVSDSEISSWTEKITLQQIRCWDTIASYTIDVDADDTASGEEIRISTNEHPLENTVLFRFEDDVGISINNLLHSFYTWQAEGHLGQDSYVGLDGEVTAINRRVEVSLSPGLFYTFTTAGKVDVLKVAIDLVTRIERNLIPLSKVYQYSNMENEITQIAVARMSVGDDPRQEYQILVQPDNRQKDEEYIDNQSDNTRS